MPSRLDPSTNTDHTNCPWATGPDVDHDLSDPDWGSKYSVWHLTRQDSADSSDETGLFNGLRVKPLQHFSTDSTTYQMQFDFTELNTDGHDGSNGLLCFVMRATDVSGAFAFDTYCVGNQSNALPAPPCNAMSKSCPCPLGRICPGICSCETSQRNQCVVSEAECALGYAPACTPETGDGKAGLRRLRVPSHHPVILGGGRSL